MENTAAEKILGAFLLFAGLAIIGASLYLGMNIYIKAQDPPEIFKPIGGMAASAETAPKKSETIAPSPKNLGEINPNDIQKMINGGLISPEMIKSVIPPEIFGYTPRLMNLTVFSIFLWVLITAGAKISSLGIALIKTNSNIKV